MPLEPYSVNVMSWRALVKKATLRLAWSLAAGGASPLRRPDRFVGISLQGSPRFLRRLLALLDHLKPGTTELMVHPGHPDGELAAWDDYTAPRARELAALTRPEVRERFRRGSFRHKTGTPQQYRLNIRLYAAQNTKSTRKPIRKGIARPSGPLGRSGDASRSSIEAFGVQITIEVGSTEKDAPSVAPKRQSPL